MHNYLINDMSHRWSSVAFLRISLKWATLLCHNLVPIVLLYRRESFLCPSSPLNPRKSLCPWATANKQSAKTQVVNILGLWAISLYHSWKICGTSMKVTQQYINKWLWLWSKNFVFTESRSQTKKDCKQHFMLWVI